MAKIIGIDLKPHYRCNDVELLDFRVIPPVAGG